MSDPPRVRLAELENRMLTSNLVRRDEGTRL